MLKKAILLDGSMEDAYRSFENVKNSIEDFKKESVCIKGNLKIKERGWNVSKIIY